MSVHESVELAVHLRRFQTLYLNVLRYMMTASPDFQQTDRIDMLKTIWDKAHLSQSADDQQSLPTRVSWARLGLDQGDDMFASSGVLGLECLVSAVPLPMPAAIECALEHNFSQHWYATHERNYSDVSRSEARTSNAVSTETFSVGGSAAGDCRRRRRLSDRQSQASLL
jgi:hypothetical protein